jgi:hypothetical protein
MFGDQEKARSEWGAPVVKGGKPHCAALISADSQIISAAPRERDTGGNQSADNRSGRSGAPALPAPVHGHNDRLVTGRRSALTGPSENHDQDEPWSV